MTQELEQARAEIAQLQRELAQNRLALEDFTYSVSHDLRASLRHVTSYLKIVREDLGAAVDANILAHLDTAGGAAAHMVQLMDGLLELSRVGRAEMQLSDVDLGRLIADVRHQLENGMRQREVQWKIAADVPLVHGDIAMLAQMLAQLLGNAIKFTRDCPVASIDISWTARGDGFCELHISDNGVGFDARFRDRLFRVFQRLHSPKQFEGIGIGLALARAVVERHGGSIRAEAGVGAGCRISLTLPVAGADAGVP